MQSSMPQHMTCPKGLDHFPATQRFVPKPEIASDEDGAPEPKVCLTGKALEAAMKKGYNDAGHSVQLPQSWLPDREIFRRTLLRGKMEVTYGDLSMRKLETGIDGKKKRLP